MKPRRKAPFEPRKALKVHKEAETLEARRPLLSAIKPTLPSAPNRDLFEVPHYSGEMAARKCFLPPQPGILQPLDTP